MIRTVLGVLLPMLAALPALAEAPRPPAFRLGNGATPLAYDLRLEVDPAAPRFRGEAAIRLRLERPLETLWLNATRLEVERATLRRGDAALPLRVIPGGDDFVGFQAADSIAPGEATLELSYAGALEGTGTRGIFRQNEGGQWYALTQFEAINARRAFPSFDEPHWKTPYRLAIDAPEANVVLSNEPAGGVEAVAGRPGWLRHRFGETRPLPTYLVAFAVGPFSLLDGGAAGARPTPLRYAAPQGREAEARFPREATPRLLELLEGYFGSPHPFTKLDSVAIPATVGFGAMENVGLVTYGSYLLLARPQDDSPGFRRRYASIAAHEIAHQWFGNMVTLAWWDDIWLNEAFATWMARKTVEAYEPAWVRGWRRGEERRRAILADRLASARQVRNPVVEKNDIYGAFDAITYEKGAEVISMFESWLGPERFRQGVRDYLAAHRWGSATSADFFRAIGAAAGRGEAAMAAFEGFVAQPGLPLVDVALRCTAGKPALHLAQQRFAAAGSPAQPQRWLTPACFRYRADGVVRKQCEEVTNEPRVVPLKEARACADWVAGNADGAGHWVARYDPATRKRLARSMSALPEDEAVALAGDTAVLVGAGLLPRAEGLQLAAAFLRHPAMGVRHGGVNFLERQRETQLSASDARARRALLGRFVQPMARRVGWLPRERDDFAVHELRAVLLPYAARSEGGEALRREARRLALAWLDDRAALPASSLPGVVQTAGRFADGATFERLVDALERTADRRDRYHLGQSLARVRDARLRQRVLDLALAPGGAAQPMDGREALDLLQAALEDEHNAPAAFAFVRANWDAVQARIPPDSQARLIRALGAGLCTGGDREEFARFFAPQAAGLRGGPRAYSQALEAIDLCVRARSRPPSGA